MSSATSTTGRKHSPTSPANGTETKETMLTNSEKHAPSISTTTAEIISCPPSSADSPTSGPGALVLLPLDLLDEHPNQPRLALHEETLSGLIAQMTERGSYDPTHPIQVRVKPDGRYEVLSGSHRREAAKRAGFTEAWVVIVEATDHEAYMSLLTNNVTAA